MGLLLKRDDLSIEEIVIWDSLTQWALTQHPNIPKASLNGAKKKSQLWKEPFIDIFP